MRIREEFVMDKMMGRTPKANSSQKIAGLRNIRKGGKKDEKFEKGFFNLSSFICCIHI